MRRSTEERRQQISEAALRIITVEGLAAFTTAAVAAEVGIAEGTIFRHFLSKEAILDAVVDRVEESFGALPEEGTPLERLRIFFLERTELVRRNPAIVRLLYSDQLALAGSPEAAARLTKLKESSLDFIHSMLKRASAQGQLRRGLAVGPTVAIIQGAALALAFSGALGEGKGLSPAVVWKTLETLIAKPTPSE